MQEDDGRTVAATPVKIVEPKVVQDYVVFVWCNNLAHRNAGYLHSAGEMLDDLVVANHIAQPRLAK